VGLGVSVVEEGGGDGEGLGILTERGERREVGCGGRMAGLVYFGGEEEGVVVGADGPRRALSSMVPAAEESREQEDIEIDGYRN